MSNLPKVLAALNAQRAEVASDLARLDQAIAVLTGAGSLRRAKGRKAGVSGSTGRRRRRKMTAAQRKAISARMKKYWAARRKTKAST